MVGMEGDTQRQACFLSSLGPTLENILMGTDVLGVPLLILRIPEVEVIVVVTQYEEILGATTLITLHECLGIPILGLEKRQDVLKAEL